MPEDIILVDENDNQIGVGEKLTVHQQGILHRAFSVLIFDQNNRLLLQKRAATKYHSPNLWSNACCSHPRPGEKTLNAAHRRLKEEFGFDCELKEAGQLTYRAQLGNDLIEHEYLHIFRGAWSGEPKPNANEIGEYKWVAYDQLLDDIQHHPENYTEWFRLIIQNRPGI